MADTETPHAVIDEETLLGFLEMTFNEIEAAGYELTYLYSENGPGAPIYSVGGYEGIQICFLTDEDENYQLSETDKPWRIDIISSSVSLFGLNVGVTGDTSNEVISEWDSASLSGSFGTYCTSKTVGDYSLTAYREIPEKELYDFCANNDINIEDYSEDLIYYDIVPLFAETQKKNPNGEIVRLSVKKSPNKVEDNSALGGHAEG